MDFWNRARTFADEAAKKSQELRHTIAATSLSDVVSEASKRSKELALEASKRSKELAAEALKRADQITAAKSYTMPAASNQHHQFRRAGSLCPLPQPPPARTHPIPNPNSKSNSTAAAALYGDSKKHKGSSEFVKLKYHMGPVLTADITVYPIWHAPIGLLGLLIHGRFDGVVHSRAATARSVP